MPLNKETKPKPPFLYKLFITNFSSFQEINFHFYLSIYLSFLFLFLPSFPLFLSSFDSIEADDQLPRDSFYIFSFYFLLFLCYFHYPLSFSLFLSFSLSLSLSLLQRPVISFLFLRKIRKVHYSSKAMIGNNIQTLAFILYSFNIINDYEEFVCLSSINKKQFRI